MSVDSCKTMLLNAFYDLDAFRQDWINGYWQFPVPEIVVDYVQEMRDEIKQLKMQLEEALDAQ